MHRTPRAKRRRKATLQNDSGMAPRSGRLIDHGNHGHRNDEKRSTVRFGSRHRVPSGSARYGRSPYRHASFTRHGLAVTFSGVGIGIATAGLLVTPFASFGGSRATGSALPLSARSRSPLRCRYCRHHAKRLNRIPIRRSTAMPPSLAGSLSFTASRARRISCRLRSWLRWWRRRRRSRPRPCRRTRRYVHGISSLGTALGRALRPANGNATIGLLTVGSTAWVK
jgi:hypothetical protein